jgi:hypothetical protein
VFFQNPPALLRTLSREKEALLKELWDFVGDKVVERDREAGRRLSSGLALTLRETSSGRSILVVTLPPPQEPPEAYFVGLILEPPRYITLERGTNLAGGTRTVLCEWTERIHANMGDGPEPTIESFVHALGSLAGPVAT